MSGGMESDDACGGCGLFFKAPEFASAPGISDRAPVRAVSEGLKGGKPDRNRGKAVCYTIGSNSLPRKQAGF